MKWNYERIRNNSLSWKWIWVNLEVPSKWTIDYAITGSGIIQSKSFTWSVETLYEDISFKDWVYIDKIECFDVNWGSLNEVAASYTWTIEITTEDILLVWDCNPGAKILEISLTNSFDTNIVKINVLSWLVEIK